MAIDPYSIRVNTRTGQVSWEEAQSIGPVRMLPGSPIPFKPQDRVELTQEAYGLPVGTRGIVTTEPPLGHNVRRSVVVRFDGSGRMYEVPVGKLSK